MTTRIPRAGGNSWKKSNRKQFGLKHISYTYREGEGGIADALARSQES
jgi:hypothetical protein